MKSIVVNGSARKSMSTVKLLAEVACGAGEAV